MSVMTVELARAPYAFARAVAATVLIMVGATAAHTWAGGHLPGVPALLALTGVVLGAGLLVLRGSLRWQVLLPVVWSRRACCTACSACWVRRRPGTPATP